MRKFSYLLLGLFSFSVACNSNQKAAESAAFDVAGMDTSIKPGDNFFLYANGGWIKQTTIPDDQSGWGSFYTLYNDNLKNMRGILDELAAGAAKATKGSAEQKVGDFYASGMDSATIEQRGFTPIQPILKQIQQTKSIGELVQLAMEQKANGEEWLISWYVGPDEKNSATNVLSFYQTGLNLPEKEYYTKNDSTTKAFRAAMVHYAHQLFQLTGSDSATAAQQAADVLLVETALATYHLLPVELRDPIKNYNKMSVAQLQQLSPAIDWKKGFSTLGLTVDSINVAQPNYYKGLSQQLTKLPLTAWKAKIQFDYMHHHAGALSSAFVNKRFEFRKLFTGAKQQEERWKRMVNTTDGSLKDLVGQLYVAKYFPPEAKKRMDELVANLQKAFAVRIQQLDWMSDTTKAQAITKLNAIINKIGYPEKWKSFDDVSIERGKYFENLQQVAKHEWKEAKEKIGKAVDKTEWGMTVPTVNAYYNPTINEIVFPAGILQSPFFNLQADDAVNYGGIGMVIGHELTHGFDDQGRQYDEKGNLRDWWTAGDATRFKARADEVVKLYNSYTILDSMHLNGTLTLGENLADFGGLSIAFDAFKMTDQFKKGEAIDGFSPAQRFFLGYAQVWRLVNRPETMRVRVSTDPHSPEEYRVNGPLSNFSPFYEAFKVTEGQKMFRPLNERIQVW